MRRATVQIGAARKEQRLILVPGGECSALCELGEPELKVIERELVRSLAVEVLDRPLRARSALVDDHLLATLGVQPEQGRLFALGSTVW